MNNIKKRGSRAEVFHGVAIMTTGGLQKTDLVKNKHGYIVSLKKVKHSKDPKKNPLLAKGLLAKRRSKKFGALVTASNSKSSRKNSYIQPFINMFKV